MMVSGHQEGIVGVVASSKVLPLLAIPAIELAESVATCNRVVMASGFQTTVERAFLLSLLPQASVLLLPARDFSEGNRLYSGDLWQKVKEGLRAGSARIISSPGVRGTRITRQNAEIRNNYLIEIADVLLVLSAPAESKTHALALKALQQGTQVFTFEHTEHQGLFDAGAQEATMAAIRSAVSESIELKGSRYIVDSDEDLQMESSRFRVREGQAPQSRQTKNCPQSPVPKN